ncbi:TPA: WG repeat-containing protein [Providencia rettgeri]
MVRYFIGLVSLIVIAGSSVAQNLEEQFSLWVADEKDKINCFDSQSDFQYCLRALPNKGLVVVDETGQEVYQLYYFDNWPDEPQEGVYRIRKEDKIGFADALTGKIVIEAIYDCAYPFNGGKAKVGVGCETQTDGEHSWWVGGEWITISR